MIISSYAGIKLNNADKYLIEKNHSSFFKETILNILFFDRNFIVNRKQIGSEIGGYGKSNFSK